MLGYQVVLDDEGPGDYLRFLEPFELLGGEREMPGLIGQDPGEGYSAMDTAELIINVRGPLMCIPRGAIITETLETVTDRCLLRAARSGRADRQRRLVPGRRDR